jgi:hypothetical protein
LLFADRQRVIFVGLLAKRFGDKLVPRHLAHGVEHARVANTAIGKLRADHPFALALRRIALGRKTHSFCRSGRPRAAVPTWVSRDQ